MWCLKFMILCFLVSVLLSYVFIVFVELILLKMCSMVLFVLLCSGFLSVLIVLIMVE